MKLWNREPTLIVAFIAAAIALGVGFGLPVTNVQQGLIMAFVIAGLALVTRSQVAPTSTVVAQTVDGVVVAGPASVVDDGAPVDVFPVGMPNPAAG